MAIGMEELAAGHYVCSSISTKIVRELIRSILVLALLLNHEFFWQLHLANMFRIGYTVILIITFYDTVN